MQRYLKRETELFVDGLSAGTAAACLEPLQFVLGGGGPGTGARPGASDFRGLTIHRTALTAAEVPVLRDGFIIPASLEICAPLQDALLAGEPVANLALSAAQLVAYASDSEDCIRALGARYAAADTLRTARLIVAEKQPLSLPESTLQSYVGVYEIAPGSAIEIILGADGLVAINPYGDRLKLYAEAAGAFFVRYPLAEITLSFVLSEDGSVSHAVLRMGDSEVQARRRADN
ncbi:MAG TPA: hypothetical protein PK186_09275 [candidate division Zixibacteria bacterium]|nr:hypothetical protein [candidate division Zixibacteria bacterium]MDD4916428.1 hypothetical protein [candidate division Zixibacteria bacterium]MDM7972567.1 hypothetical protein [candidate division Zixibacteria bacterium]HOD65647.1 hypothetical protein [candidate division Zixibacteria bacterium]HPM37733.1 hypothetical protein [candidate division Zixibacteria bacterium]